MVVRFDLEAKVLDHAPDFGGWLAWCREVPVYEDGVGWIEGEGLEGPKIMFAASGNAKFGARVQETEEAEDFQAALWCEIVAVLQRRACSRMEHVQWDRIRADFAECHGEVDEVLILLTHADDSTGADFQACRSSAPDAAQSVLEGMSRTD